MADSIAIMNAGRVEQLGPPEDLYERPRTAFVAGFLGVSNLLKGVVSSDDTVKTQAGDVRVADGLPAAGTEVAIGVRPEKLRLGGDGVNRLAGTIAERAYIGIATQYIVETQAGRISVFVQSSGHAVEGDAVTVSWDPENTFVIEEAK